MKKSILKLRLDGLRDVLSEDKTALFLVSKPTNISYLTGVLNISSIGREAFVIITSSKAIILVSPLRIEQFNKLSDFAKLPLSSKNTLTKVLQKLVKNKKTRDITFEADDLSISELTKLNKKIDSNFVQSSNCIEQLRVIKDQEEIKLIRAACQKTRRVFEQIKKTLNPGKTEKNIAWEIESLLRKSGADGTPEGFKPIVAFSTNSAIPHHIASDRKLKNRDLALIDFGCTYKGYASDFTRVIFIGQPTEKQKQVYKAVKQAQKNAINKIKSTIKAKEIDRAARQYLSQKKLGKFFIHDTGHGLGLDIHELPVIGQKDNSVIVPGMIFTIEPGVYFPGKFGIRHEDTILVSRKTTEVLTKS